MKLSRSGSSVRKKVGLIKTFQKVIKADFRKELQRHLDADAIIQGSYGHLSDKEFRGCMMGCAAKSMLNLGVDVRFSNNHKEQADLLGIPLWFVPLYEIIFEGVKTPYCKRWVIDCFEAIPEGVDIEKIEALKVPIKIFIIESTYKNHENKVVLAACKDVVKSL